MELQGLPNPGWEIVGGDRFATPAPAPAPIFPLGSSSVSQVTVCLSILAALALWNATFRTTFRTCTCRVTLRPSISDDERQ